MCEMQIENVRYTVNQSDLQPFKKNLTVNTGMVMVNYKKYEMIQSQMDKCFFV
mgnify:FL=1